MSKHARFAERLVALALRCEGETQTLAAGVLERLPPDRWGEEVVAALHLAAGFEPHENADECRLLLLDRLKQPDADR